MSQVADRRAVPEAGRWARSVAAGKPLVAVSRLEALGWGLPDDAALARGLQRGAALIEVALAPGLPLRLASQGCARARDRVERDLQRLAGLAHAHGVPLYLTDDSGAVSDEELAYVAARAGATGGVVVGRCTPGAPVAGAAIAAGFPPAPAWHLASILSCGAGHAELGEDGTAAPPGAGAALIGTLDAEGFTLEVADPAVPCRPAAVAVMSLLGAPGGRRRVPGGELVLSAARFAALAGARVRVTGSRFVAAR
jgi:hypothetical protein